MNTFWSAFFSPYLKFWLEKKYIFTPDPQNWRRRGEEKKLCLSVIFRVYVLAPLPGALGCGSGSRDQSWGSGFRVSYSDPLTEGCGLRVTDPAPETRIWLKSWGSWISDQAQEWRIRIHYSGLRGSDLRAADQDPASMVVQADPTPELLKVTVSCWIIFTTPKKEKKILE